MTTVATSTNILDVQKQAATKHVLAEHDEQANSSMPHVPFICRWSRYGDVVDDNVGEDQSKQMAMKNLSNRAERFQKPNWPSPI
jgi:hypothetical protein